MKEEKNDEEKLTQRFKKNGFIVPFLFYTFYFAERISLFYWIRIVGDKIEQKCGKEKEDRFFKSYLFPEVWVVINLFLGIFCLNVVFKKSTNEVIYIFFFIFFMLRIFEMFVYQVNVLFFHRLNKDFFPINNTQGEKANQNKNDSPVAKSNDQSEQKEYHIRSATRTVLLLIINMGEYILYFAVLMAVLAFLSNKELSGSGIGDSFQVFMNFADLSDYKDMPLSVLVYCETVIGVFMNLLCLARFVGMLPEVKSLPEEKPKE